MSFMKKIISLSAMVVASLALSAFALAVITLITTTTTTAPFSAYADAEKGRVYSSESSVVTADCNQQAAKEFGTNCSQAYKDVLGQPLNPAAREQCESDSNEGDKCKQVH